MAGPFSLTRTAVKRHAWPDWKGVYKLTKSRNGPVRYVGRSDNDVQARLLDHVRDGEYRYFTVEHKDSTKEAWLREAHLYHYHRDDLDNKRHPAPPEGMSCPKCTRYD